MNVAQLKGVTIALSIMLGLVIFAVAARGLSRDAPAPRGDLIAPAEPWVAESIVRVHDDDAGVTCWLSFQSKGISCLPDWSFQSDSGAR